MRTGHPCNLPRLWLLTDERQGAALWPAIRRLPMGSGIVMRHYTLSLPERRRLFERLRAIARSRNHILLLARDEGLARRWKSDGVYGAGDRARKGIRAYPVHNLREIRAAERAKADLLLLSPLFKTRSHPGSTPLGPMHFAKLARSTRLPVLALGGVESRHGTVVRKLGAYGWAAIDGFVRKVTPRNL